MPVNKELNAVLYIFCMNKEAKRNLDVVKKIKQ